MLNKCRVILVDDHAVFREALCKGLELTGKITIVGEADSTPKCMSLLKRTRCDVLLLDLSLPGRGGADVLSHSLQQHPDVAVLILSAHPPDRFIARLIQEGASGFLHKSSSLSRVTRGILRANSGRLVMDEDLAEVIARMDSKKNPGAAHEMLSNREHQVMNLLVAGISSTHIAEQMNLSIKTVSTYRKRLLDKLDLHSNAELVSYAIRHSLMDNA